MLLDFREDGAQNSESLGYALFTLLVVRHGTLSGESPKAHFGMNLKSPLLAFWRDRVIHLLDLCRDSPRLSVQPPARLLPIGRSGVTYDEVAKKFGVNKNVAGRWCREAGLSRMMGRRPKAQ